MNNELKQSIYSMSETLTTSASHRTDKQIKKADYDKTYLGTVLAENTRPDGSKRWLIGCDNGMSYEIKPEQSNIKEVGQKVRLYIPNHDYMRKYAETLTNGDLPDLIKDLGDGLYQYGEDGDIFCTLKLIGADVESNKVRYHYGKYDIVVSWTGNDSADKSIRTNPKWNRYQPNTDKEYVVGGQS